MDLYKAMNSFISNFKKLPLAAILSILVILLVQIVLANSSSFWDFCYLYSTPRDDDNIRLKSELKRIAREKKRKIFLIGSSQVREGFDTSLLNKALRKTDIRFYNLGVSGGAPPTDMYLLKNKLLKEKPNTIIYMPFVESFYYSYQFSKLKYYFDPFLLPETIDALKMDYSEIHRRALVHSFIGYTSLLFKYRDSLKKILEKRLIFSILDQKKSSPDLFASEKMRKDTYFKKEIIKSQGHRYKITRYTEGNKKLFLKFAQEVKNKGIEFIVISGPTNPLINLTYPREIDKDYEAFLRKASQDIGFKYLSKDDLPDFKKEDFSDFSHLNEKGRISLTKFLLEYLIKAN